MINPSNLYKLPKGLVSKHDAKIETFYLSRFLQLNNAVLNLTPDNRVPKEKILILLMASIFATPTAGVSVTSVKISLVPPENQAQDLAIIASDGFAIAAGVQRFKNFTGEIWLPENWGLNYEATFDAGGATNRLFPGAYGLLIPLSNVNRKV